MSYENKLQVLVGEIEQNTAREIRRSLKNGGIKIVLHGKGGPQLWFHDEILDGTSANLYDLRIPLRKLLMDAPSFHCGEESELLAYIELLKLAVANAEKEHRDAGWI